MLNLQAGIRLDVIIFNAALLVAYMSRYLQIINRNIPQQNITCLHSSIYIRVDTYYMFLYLCSHSSRILYVLDE